MKRIPVTPDVLTDQFIFEYDSWVAKGKPNHRIFTKREDPIEQWGVDRGLSDHLISSIKNLVATEGGI